jgi:hypothetical protein
MRTLFLTLLLTSLLGGALGAVFFHGDSAGTSGTAGSVAKDNSEGESEPCPDDPSAYCGRLRVPGG